MNKTTLTKGSCLLMLVVCSCMPLVVSAGEIYGRVGLDGKVYNGATVTITCPGYSESHTARSNGAYRSPGPSGEQKCSITVGGASNSVPIITSQGRTRVNLEVKEGRLYRR